MPRKSLPTAQPPATSTTGTKVNRANLPFQCDKQGCLSESGWKDRASYNHHNSRMHPTDAQKARRESNSKCDTCDAVCDSPADLKKHRYKHDEFKCGAHKCFAEFETRAELYAHQEVHREARRLRKAAAAKEALPCKFSGCGKILRGEAALEAHLKNSHPCGVVYNTETNMTNNPSERINYANGYKPEYQPLTDPANYDDPPKAKATKRKAPGSAVLAPPSKKVAAGKKASAAKAPLARARSDDDFEYGLDDNNSFSDSEELDPPTPPTPPTNGRHVKTIHHSAKNNSFDNPDLSDSDMSVGISPTHFDSPPHRQNTKLGPGLFGGRQPAAANEGEGHAAPAKRFLPPGYRKLPSRGVVPGTGFELDSPSTFPDDTTSSLTQLQGTDAIKRVSDTMAPPQKQVSMNFTDDVNTPDMNWIVRGSRELATPAANGNANASTQGGGVAGAAGGKKNKGKKKLARTPIVKRKYIWKTERKNKGKLYDSRKNGGKDDDNDDAEAMDGAAGGESDDEMI